MTRKEVNTHGPCRYAPSCRYRRLLHQVTGHFPLHHYIQRGQAAAKPQTSPPPLRGVGGRGLHHRICLGQQIKTFRLSLHERTKSCGGGGVWGIFYLVDSSGEAAHPKSFSLKICHWQFTQAPTTPGYVSPTPWQRSHQSDLVCVCVRLFTPQMPSDSCVNSQRKWKEDSWHQM